MVEFFKGVCKFFFEVREEGFLFVLVFLVKEIYGNKIYCYFLRFLIRKCVCIVNDWFLECVDFIKYFGVFLIFLDVFLGMVLNVDLLNLRGGFVFILIKKYIFSFDIWIILIFIWIM